MLQCHLPHSLVYRQQRRSFRIRVPEDSRMSRCVIAPADQPPRRARIVDLSSHGFGAVLLSRADLTIGDTLDCELSVDEHLLITPTELRSLECGGAFYNCLGNARLPGGLRVLMFGHLFNQSLDSTTLPSGLQHLRLGGGFNQSLDYAGLPRGLRLLVLGSDFKQDVDIAELPADCVVLLRHIE